MNGINTMLAEPQFTFGEGDAVRMPKYEVTIYNQAVRLKVEDGGHHEHFTDDWADFRYIEIRAENEDQARARLEDRYPAKQGFVIDSIVQQEDSKFE